MRTFQMKWLFVGVAVLALLCGWIADHRGLSTQLEIERRSVRRLTNDRTNLLKLMSVAGSFGYFGIEQPANFMPGTIPGEILLLSEGEVDDMTAWYLATSGFPNIHLKDVRVTPEAKQVLAEEFDDRFDGTYHLYWRRQPRASVK